MKKRSTLIAMLLLFIFVKSILLKKWSMAILIKKRDALAKQIYKKAERCSGNEGMKELGHKLDKLALEGKSQKQLEEIAKMEIAKYHSDLDFLQSHNGKIKKGAEKFNKLNMEVVEAIEEQKQKNKIFEHMETNNKITYFDDLFENAEMEQDLYNDFVYLSQNQDCSFDS